MAGEHLEQPLILRLTAVDQLLVSINHRIHNCWYEFQTNAHKICVDSQIWKLSRYELPSPAVSLEEIAALEQEIHNQDEVKFEE